MASVLTPSLPLTGPWLIDREDCIGDSLVNINANTNNFAYRLDQFRQPLNTTVIYVNDGAGSATYNGPGGPVSVTAGGNDSTGNGSTTAPFKTLKKAVEYLYSRDANLNSFVAIRLCPGNYMGCSIANYGVGTGVVKGQLDWQDGGLLIQGSTNSYINQFQPYSTPSPLFTHLMIRNSLVIIDGVTFRYRHSVNPFTPTATAGGGTLTNYHVVNIDQTSRVDFFNTVFESIPQVLTTNSPQQAYAKYVSVSNFSTVTFSDITINNTSVDNFGAVGNNANARYFILPYNSNIYMYGNCTLQNGPRFSAFIEPARASNFYQEGGFAWVGAFGSQLGSGGGDRLFDANPVPASTRDYLPGQAKNYIVKQDGPHGNALYVWAAGYPANSYGAAYSQASMTTWFALDQRRAS